MSRNIEHNAERFTGFAEEYDASRPHCPPYALKAIQNYLGRRPETVVDLGCGTGLSTIPWADYASRVIGVEPSGDMIAIARKKAEKISGVEFRRAYASKTGLPDGCADAVTCSQSFHWMEPWSTLREVDRILKPGGVFAAYDCDWPPVCDRRAEEAWCSLEKTVREIGERFPSWQESDKRWIKDRHLESVRKSGYFSYVREIVFQNAEECTALRLISLAESRGGVQGLLKISPKLLEKPLAEFRKTILSLYCGTVFSVDFCYRMRVGVKEE